MFSDEKTEWDILQKSPDDETLCWITCLQNDLTFFKVFFAMLRESESYGKQTKTSSPQESFTLVKHEFWDLWTV